MPELVQGRAWKQEVGRGEREEKKEGLENRALAAGTSQIRSARLCSFTHGIFNVVVWFLSSISYLGGRQIFEAQ